MEVFILLLVIGVGIYIAVTWVKATAAKEALRMKQSQADAFLNNLQQTKTLPKISVSIVLKKGESGILQEQSNLYETRAQRVYGGAGTRIGKISFGGGVSESVQQLRLLDAGTLVLTSQRLVFDGGTQNRSTNLDEILSANAWQDGIEISSSKRQKSQLYSVSNSMIWASMIQNLAEGRISVDQKDIKSS